MTEKILPGDFMKNGSRAKLPLKLPTFYVTKQASGAVAPSKLKVNQPVLYSVDSIDRLAEAFENNERRIKSGS